MMESKLNRSKAPISGHQCSSASIWNTSELEFVSFLLHFEIRSIRRPVIIKLPPITNKFHYMVDSSWANQLILHQLRRRRRWPSSRQTLRTFSIVILETTNSLSPLGVFLFVVFDKCTNLTNYPLIVLNWVNTPSIAPRVQRSSYVVSYVNVKYST